MLVTWFTTFQNNDLITMLFPKDLCEYYKLGNLDVLEVFQSVTGFPGTHIVPSPPRGPHV